MIQRLKLIFEHGVQAGQFTQEGIIVIGKAV